MEGPFSIESCLPEVRETKTDEEVQNWAIKEALKGFPFTVENGVIRVKDGQFVHPQPFPKEFIERLRRISAEDFDNHIARFVILRLLQEQTRGKTGIGRVAVDIGTFLNRISADSQGPLKREFNALKRALAHETKSTDSNGPHSLSAEPNSSVVSESASFPEEGKAHELEERVITDALRGVAENVWFKGGLLHYGGQKEFSEIQVELGEFPEWILQEFQTIPAETFSHHPLRYMVMRIVQNRIKNLPGWNAPASVIGMFLNRFAGPLRTLLAEQQQKAAAYYAQGRVGPFPYSEELRSKFDSVVSDFDFRAKAEEELRRRIQEQAEEARRQAALRAEQAGLAGKERQYAIREAVGAARRVEQVSTMSAKEQEKAKNIDRVFTTYRAKWLAGGGHTDPSTFNNALPSLVELAKESDREMRERLREPGPENLVGTTMEVFLGVELEEQRWFDAEVIRVAAYDDFANSLDLALEWEPDEETGVIPRLAVDFTTAQTPGILNHKLEKLRRGISVNFYRSKVETKNGEPFEGRVEDLPMVILGLSSDVLSDVGGALSRGEKMTPDHPLRALLVRQAHIQVGQQIRDIGADLVLGVMQNSSSDPVVSGVVRTYLDAKTADPEFVNDAARVADVLSAIPSGSLEHALGKRTANRLRTLFAVHKRLERQMRQIDVGNPDVSKMEQQVKLSRRLKGRTEDAQQPAMIKTSPSWGGFSFEPE